MIGGKVMRVLDGYEPTEVLKFFEDISNIPRLTYHEKEVSDYCVNFAKERGLYYEQDSLGNVIIIKEATPGYEEVEPVILQGHLDMVGDKVPGCTLDLLKDGIKIMVEGDYITADGTTLGGDDGIAVAYGLALLDAKDIPHPRLEVVFTAAEEVGLDGANGIDLSSCKARRLINLDSEEEGVFTAGCAGGLRAVCVLPVETEPATGILCEVKTAGFQGGHSGAEIHKGRANAITTLGRFFMQNQNEKLVSFSGGVKDNVIPKNAVASFVSKDAKKTKEAVEAFNAVLAAEYGVSDKDVKLVLTIGEECTCSALNETSQVKVLTALNVMPNGVQAMSQDLPGLVETSLNMGVVNWEADQFTFSFSIRSSVTSAKYHLYDKLVQLMKALGGTITSSGDYPAWPYARESKLRDLCIKTFKEQYGKEPVVEVIHAGLECGILSGKIKGLDCISMGPDMVAVHTPDEKISISSIQRVWEFLKVLLASK